ENFTKALRLFQAMKMAYVQDVEASISPRHDPLLMHPPVPQPKQVAPSHYSLGKIRQGPLHGEERRFDQLAQDMQNGDVYLLDLGCTSGRHDDTYIGHLR